MKKPVRNIEAAPNLNETKELIRHILDFGLGKELDKEGLPQMWQKQEFSERANLGSGTLDFWLEGKHLPNRESIRKLSIFIANGDKRVYKSWVDAFRKAAQSSNSSKKAETCKEDSLTTSSQIKHNETRNQVGLNPIHWLLLSILLVALPFAGYVFLATNKKTTLEDNQTVVFNLATCSEAEFSKELKVCTKESSRFPNGTKLIYISFNTHGHSPGQKFTRYWYHNGELFFSKDSYFDEVWKDWTYIGHQLLRGEGEYSLRIVTQDRAIANAIFHIE